MKAKKASASPASPSVAATVPTPSYTDAGTPVRQSVTVTLGVERTADKARDAFSVDLPIRPDRSHLAVTSVFTSCS